MLTYANIPLLLDTADRKLRSFLERRSVELSDSGFLRSALKTYSDLLEIDSILDLSPSLWYYPTGAHRFAFGHFLTDKSLSYWYQNAGVNRRYGSTLKFATTPTDTLGFDGVRILRHRAIAQLSARESLYLMTLVDPRYAGNVAGLGSERLDTLTTPTVAAILTKMNALGNLGVIFDEVVRESSTLPRVNPAALKLPDTYPPGLLFEALCNEIGFRTTYTWNSNRYNLMVTTNSESKSDLLATKVVESKSQVFEGSTKYKPWTEGDTFPTNYSIGGRAFTLSVLSGETGLVGSNDTVQLPLPRLIAVTQSQAKEIGTRWLTHFRGGLDVVFNGLLPKNLPLTSSMDYFIIEHTKERGFLTRIHPLSTYQPPVDLSNSTLLPTPGSTNVTVNLVGRKAVARTSVDTFGRLLTEHRTYAAPTGYPVLIRVRRLTTADPTGPTVPVANRKVEVRGVPFGDDADYGSGVTDANGEVRFDAPTGQFLTYVPLLPGESYTDPTEQPRLFTLPSGTGGPYNVFILLNK